MVSSISILKIYLESFSANLYTIKPFRMIGLIDVSINYAYEIERVTLAYFRSSGTNSGKIKGLWYPIVGIKTHTGRFTEFTEYINYVLSCISSTGRSREGWLAKSIFFSNQNTADLRGFSNGKHHDFLLKIGETQRNLYEKEKFHYDNSLDARNLNKIIYSKEIYPGNRYSQRENFERFIEDIFNGY